MRSDKAGLALDQDGVVLLENSVNPKIMDRVRDEYEYLDKSVTRVEVERDRPIVVLWRHVVGESKRLTNFDEFPALLDLIRESIVPTLRMRFPGRFNYLQLLETIIFNKPPHVSNTLNWHQDVAYFPLKPNNQIAIWIPFEPVTYEKSAMVYALGSHKRGIMGSTNLHTRQPFEGETRPLIPDDPSAEGFTVKCFDMGPEDMLVHDGYTWHYTGPNTVDGYIRRGLSVRFITEESVFDPRAGQGAAFTKQIDVLPGGVITGAPFPLM